MAERFEKLYSLPNNLFSEQAPVIISAGSLLKDTQSGKVVAQMKFRSVCSKTIKALMISMAAYDVAGKNLDGVEEYQYLDLNIHNSQEFGSNKAVVLPSNVTRSFSVSSVVVVFGDDTTWESSEPFTALPIPKPIENTLKDPELQKQYRLAVNNDAAYCPIEEQGIWQCACGVWNGATACSNCGAEKYKVFNSFDIETLSEATDKCLQAEREAQAAKAEQERVAAEEKAKYLAERTAKNKAIIKKVKVISTIVLPIVALVLLFALWIYPGIIQPNMAYNAALQMLESAQYDDAIDAFTELGNYKDSEEMIKKAQYSYAEMLLNAREYDSAISLFSQLTNYDDSEAMAKEAKYQKALYLAEKQALKESIDILEYLDSYRDSEAYLLELRYNYATLCLSEKKYDEAKRLYQMISEYQDSEEKVLECDYLNAQNAIDEKRYFEAGALFEQIIDYKDSSDQLIFVNYMLATEHMDNLEFDQAISLFVKSGTYRDSQNLINECYYLKAKDLINKGDYVSAVSILTKITMYKDASKYIELIEDVKSIIYVGESTSYSWEYMWVVSEIDTSNCSSRLVVYEGRADGRNDVIDITYRSGKHMLKEWKNENGLIYMTQSGNDYAENKAIFRTWKVSSDWNSIYAKSYSYKAESNDQQDVRWTRVDEDIAKSIKGAFIEYFKDNEYGEWLPEHWIAAQATMQ